MQTPSDHNKRQPLRLRLKNGTGKTTAASRILAKWIMEGKCDVFIDNTIKIDDAIIVENKTNDSN